MDYKKLNDDEIIELCKEKGIEYYNSKTKKNFAKSTLISRLNKITPEVEPKEEIKEEEPVIEYKNEVIWTLSDEDKKNNDDYKEIESKLLNCIKSCHDYLYSNGAICGLKASNDIIKIIILRLFNIIYKNDDIKVEIRNKIPLEKIDKYEPYLIDIKEFNKSLNIDNDIKLFIMNIIIPIFPNIFDGDDIKFNMRNYPKNYTTIITKITELINIDNSELFIKLFADTGGNIYEYFTNSYGKGSTSKELGQFFTPFKLINILLINIKDYIDDGYSLYDPCCGSGGLLNRTSSNLGINKDNIYGCEIEKDTIKYALASLLVNNNSFKINIINKCSLSNNNFLFENKKFNLILTNPPFGMKNITYKDLKSKFEEYRDYNFKSSDIKFEDVYPINTNNGTLLFLQHVIYMLEDNGICGIVLPDGNELTSNSFYNMRKYLIDNCKILKVINVSGGAFNSTGVKTKILIFKKQKGADNYKNIEFLEINKDCNEVKLIAIADLDKNYSFKLKINQEIIKYNSDVEIKTLGEVCEFQNGSQLDKKDIIKGDIPIFGGGFKIVGFHNKYNRNGNETIICGTGAYSGYVNQNYGKPFWASQCFTIKSKDINIITDKYLYYYSKIILETEFMSNQKGTAIPYIRFTQIIDLKIPIPPIEKQEELVKRIDIFENTNKDIINLIENLKEFNKIKLESLINKDIEFIEFGQMFDLIKGSIQSSKVVEDPCGDGIMITQSKNINDYKKIKNWIIDGNNLFVGNIDSGKKFVISFYEGKCDYTNLMSLCKIKDYYNYKINIKYIYYYLQSIKDILTENYLIGCANKSLDIEEFNLMKIPIPSIEVQEDIIEYCDNNLKIIENLNKTIEGNKKIIKDIITSI
jgi:type I restriction-modification system DNA methylase subunit